MTKRRKDWRLYLKKKKKIEKESNMQIFAAFDFSRNAGQIVMIAQI